MPDVVGLCMDPAARAVVLDVDKKSQIRAFDRAQPGLPLKKGRAGTITRDYKRRGKTTLFAPMNILDSAVIGQNVRRRRHEELVGFLNAVDAKIPAGKMAPAIRDNCAARKHPQDAPVVRSA